MYAVYAGCITSLTFTSQKRHFYHNIYEIKRKGEEWKGYKSTLIQIDLWTFLQKIVEKLLLKLI